MNTNNKFDLWLVRGSYIAQIGLLFITVFTIFYTVIPLYQNATLQESISKKEIELKELKLNSERLYSSFRYGAINSFIFQASSVCSPTLPFLLRPIEVPSPYEEDRRDFYDKKIAEIKNALNNDVNDCLRNYAKNSSFLLNLNEIDINKIMKAIDSLKPKLDDLKEKTKKDLNDTVKLIQFGRRNGVGQAEVAMGEILEQIEKEREISDMHSGANTIFYAYGKDVMDLINDALTPLR
ncbi:MULTISPECIES: hypothetical protein [Pectobacterium]|uniref:Uncharacterized protein n=1 Tax=Pectobacterium carotovorum subsp. carotovorum (strain PC1) TaxID=561230 RepID=C6DAM5_PECCP|nr:hypothetical protein [Pectobacterium carotovorum]ACT13859.1 hypothetical protein PC1_2829 [Pectobacterium carotovorum subsp. carotovorum PC1]